MADPQTAARNNLLGDWLVATTYLRLALDQMEEAGVTGE